MYLALFCCCFLKICRDEIAYCMEKSYRQVSWREAVRILYLNNQDELAEIAENVNEDVSFSYSLNSNICLLCFSMDGN